MPQMSAKSKAAALLLLSLILVGCGKKDRNPIHSDPELIFDLEVRSTTHEAAITWETSMAASSEIEYGLSSDYGYRIRDDRQLRSHHFDLKELLAGTEYYFKLSCYDGSGELKTSEEFTFRTVAEGLTLRLDPVLRLVKEGDTFTLDIRVEEVTRLAGAGVRLLFDPSLLEGLSIIPGDLLGDNLFWYPDNNKLDQGIIGIGMGITRKAAGAEKDQAVSGSGVIAKATFRAGGKGEVRISIDSDRRMLGLTGPDGNPVKDFDHLSLGSIWITIR